MSNSAKPLPPGTAAPNFTLPNATRSPLQLSDLLGRPVILTFYPADNSPVCSNQLALYNQALPLFQKHNATLLGISIDNPDSHKAFAQNLNLSFPLLADNDPLGAVARAYGVFNENNHNAYRALYVLDQSGIIRWAYVSPTNVNPGANGILAALESLD
jgi:peroxiredoxin (alkyl hydroperoxide reductase subunit C)